jgi:type II secretory pathway component GspD/PulD (secretin)
MSMVEDARNLYLIIRSHDSLANFKTNLLSENVFVVDIANTVIPESELKYIKREPLDFIKVWQYDEVRLITRVMLKLTRQADVNLKVNDLGNELRIAVSKEMVSTIFNSVAKKDTQLSDVQNSAVSASGTLNSHPGAWNTVNSSPEFSKYRVQPFGDPVNAVRQMSKDKYSQNTTYKIDDPWARTVEDEKKVTFKFTEYEISSILEFLSDALESTILIDNSVGKELRNKKISVFVKDLGIKNALKLVLDTNGLAYKKFNENTYIVVTKDKADEDKLRVERVFQLINAKPDEVISIIKKSKGLAKKINVENLSIDKRTNSLLAFDTPEKIEMLTKVIGQLDRKEKQVQIDMKLVEISRTTGKQLGIRYDDTVTITNISDMPSRIPLSATLSALSEQNKAKVLASPRIRALHQKSASIKIGETIPVPYYELLNTTSGNNNDNNNGVLGYNYNNTGSSNNGRVDAYDSEGYAVVKNFKDIDVGILLNVTPFIHDDNEVTLNLDVEVSSVVDITQEGQVHKQKRETKTTVRVGDGETAVLGGMIRDNERNRKVDVPFLGSIPGLGKLFQHHIKDVESTEMIMFITPHLVNVDDNDELTEDKFEFAKKEFLKNNY